MENGGTEGAPRGDGPSLKKYVPIKNCTKQQYTSPSRGCSADLERQDGPECIARARRRIGGLRSAIKNILTEYTWIL